MKSTNCGASKSRDMSASVGFIMDELVVVSVDFLVLVRGAMVVGLLDFV